MGIRIGAGIGPVSVSTGIGGGRSSGGDPFGCLIFIIVGGLLSTPLLWLSSLDWKNIFAWWIGLQVLPPLALFVCHLLLFDKLYGEYPFKLFLLSLLGPIIYVVCLNAIPLAKNTLEGRNYGGGACDGNLNCYQEVGKVIFVGSLSQWLISLTLATLLPVVLYIPIATHTRQRQNQKATLAIQAKRREEARARDARNQEQAPVTEARIKLNFQITEQVREVTGLVNNAENRANLELELRQSFAAMNSLLSDYSKEWGINAPLKEHEVAKLAEWVSKQTGITDLNSGAKEDAKNEADKSPHKPEKAKETANVMQKKTDKTPKTAKTKEAEAKSDSSVVSASRQTELANLNLMISEHINKVTNLVNHNNDKSGLEPAVRQLFDSMNSLLSDYSTTWGNKADSKEREVAKLAEWVSKQTGITDLNSGSS
jgi:hypothetical protein